MSNPWATESTYALLATSASTVGLAATWAVVKNAAAGVVPPIMLLLMVLLVMAKPLWFGLIGAKNGVPAGPTKY